VPSRPAGRAPRARAERRGAPGWHGAQRHDRVRDGRRRHRVSFGEVVAIPSPIGKPVRPRKRRRNRRRFGETEQRRTFLLTRRASDSRGGSSTDTDSHGVSDPRDGAGTAAAAREGVAHAMVSASIVVSSPSRGGEPRRPNGAPCPASSRRSACEKDSCGSDPSWRPRHRVPRSAVAH